MKNLSKKIAMIFHLFYGISLICPAQAQDMKFSASLHGLETTMDFGNIFLIALVAIIPAAIIISAMTVKARRCPFCKSRMHKSGFETTRISRNAVMHTTIYTCPGCGNVRTRTRKINHSLHNDGVKGCAPKVMKGDHEKYQFPHLKNGERKRPHQP